MNSASNTATTTERELTNEELDAVSGGERSPNCAEERWGTFAPNIGDGVMSAAFALVGTFF
jgi:bacteriocin-like protein